jgi:hypothetical protein
MSSNSDSIANFNLPKQDNEANKQAILELIAKRRKDKKHQQRSEKNKKSYAEALGIKKDGPQERSQQVLSLLAKNGSGHKGYYYYYKSITLIASNSATPTGKTKTTKTPNTGKHGNYTTKS